MNNKNTSENSSRNVSSIVVVGGGTAGWMSAAALAKLLDPNRFSVTVVESDQIGTVGVGEATLPHLRFFNQRLGIAESAFMAATNASFKAGIEFVNWGRVGDAYIHPFGDYGSQINNIGFHHYWLKAKNLGDQSKLDEYSLPIKFCHAGKFDFPSDDPSSINSTYSYAYHIDSNLYAKFLRGFCEDLGVLRKEGKIVDVGLNTENGLIETVRLDDDSTIYGDFFIDCSGFRSLLLGEALGVKFESWKHWLPCDRAIAAPTENEGDPLPYTQASAYEAGWQWRIPLQHRTGNGYVYASDYITDEAASTSFLERIQGEPLRDPINLRFEAGRRIRSWERNCVAIGLSSGFLEPLESTSIYLIQIAIMKLLELFPQRLDQLNLSEEFNRQMSLEYERTRDFLILHYHATERSDTDFWNYVRTMSIPDSLKHKMSLFKANGYISPYAHGLFLEPSWLAVYIGQRHIPERCDARVAAMPGQGLLAQLEKYRALIAHTASEMPSHLTTINRVCENKQPMKSSSAKMSLYGASRS